MSEQDELESVLTVQETAERLKCSERTITRLVNSDRIKAYRISAEGRKREMIRIPTSSIRDYLEGTVPSRPERVKKRSGISTKKHPDLPWLDD